MATFLRCYCEDDDDCRYRRKLRKAFALAEAEYPIAQDYDDVVVKIVDRVNSYCYRDIDEDVLKVKMSCRFLQCSSLDEIKEAFDFSGYEEDCLIEDCEYGDLDEEEEEYADQDDSEYEDENDEYSDDDEDEEDDDEYEDNLSRAIRKLDAAQKIRYPIKVVEGDDINGEATADGEIHITSAAAEQLSEEELAFLISHEEAHLNKHHWLKTLGVIAAAKVGLDTIANDEEKGSLRKLAEMAAMGTIVIASAPLVSKSMEVVADIEAQKRMTEAGYDEEDAHLLLERLGDQEGRYFSTHPTSQFRRNMLK